MDQQLTARLTAEHKSVFGGRCETGGQAAILFAPGRVNLIGDHIDYNGGRVLPMSLSMGTYCAVTPRTDKTIGLYSLNFPHGGAEEYPLAQNAECEFAVSGWAAYPMSVIYAYAEAGITLPHGFNMTIMGDIPRGSGLSSSASLEILTCAVIRTLFGINIDGKHAALLSQRAENRFVGVNCGIMDQAVCAIGKAGDALLLNTSTLEYSYIPFDIEGCTLLILDTCKPRSLVTSAYNTRRAECEAALMSLNRSEGGGIDSLCSLSTRQFENICGNIQDKTLLRRARHAVSENERVTLACAALKEGGACAAQRFGALMNASHASLRDDYEVSCEELDVITEAARRQEGVFGARMTGAGFAGCAVALVEAERAANVTRGIESEYQSRFARSCAIYRAVSANAPFAQ